jgi:hypothetical protein
MNENSFGSYENAEVAENMRKWCEVQHERSFVVKFQNGKWNVLPV